MQALPHTAEKQAEISKFVNLEDLSERYKCTTRTICRWQKTIGFPKPM